MQYDKYHLLIKFGDQMYGFPVILILLVSLWCYCGNIYLVLKGVSNLVYVEMCLKGKTGRHTKCMGSNRIVQE